MSVSKHRKPRDTYRHGNLKEALLETGIELARQHGPDGVILREATRRIGVAFSAAYRHYDGQTDLLDAVRAAALAKVARTMENELASLGPPNATPAYARDNLRAIGKGYLRFAREEAGLFRTAFVMPRADREESDKQHPNTGDTGLNPFQLLGQALDRMHASGILPSAQRSGAEYLAWSAVHGMAMLILDGPLRHAPPERLDTLSERLLYMVEKGLQNTA